MRSASCFLLALCLAALPGAGAARAAAPLVMLVDHSEEMPSARIERGQVLDGISHDLAQLLGERLGREPRFLVLPRRRVAQALESGEADLLCDYLPAWLPGPFAWSRPFLPGAYWIVTRRDYDAPASLRELAGQRVGTVRGYAYPELQALLGDAPWREDAPNADAGLRMLALGRVAHAAVSQRFLQYQQRIGSFTVPLHAPLPVSSYQTQCALSPRSGIGLAALNQALGEIVSDGSLERLLQRYR